MYYDKSTYTFVIKRIVDNNNCHKREVHELAIFDQVISAIETMHKLVIKELNQLKRNGHKITIKNDDTQIVTYINDKTTNQDIIFTVEYRDLINKEDTIIPKLEDLIDDYVGNLPA